MTRFTTARIVLTLCAGLLVYQSEVKAQSVVVPTTPSIKENPADATNNLVAPARADGRTFNFVNDKIDLVAMGIAASYEDCGPDKGKCSGEGHCCRIGGSGWCCDKDKKCGEEIGDCK